jgi:hypothetical protein
MEIAHIVSFIRTGHSNLIPDDLAGFCGDICVLISAWENSVAFKLMSYEEALEADPIAAQ